MKNLAIANTFISMILWFAAIIVTLITGEIMNELIGLGLILLPLLAIGCAAASVINPILEKEKN